MMLIFKPTVFVQHKTVVYFLVALALFLNTVLTPVLAADTSVFPDKPLRPIRLNSGETYDFGGRTIDGGNIKLDGAFRCWNANNITLMNVIVTNSPRYAFLARNCTNATIKNFKMINMLDSVGGIRFDRDGISNGLTLENITGNGIGGQGIEVWNADGFNIGDVSIDNTPSGCALLLDQCKNGVVGTVTGTGNAPTMGYATFRLANNNGPNIRVKKVVSRDSGRGFFSLTGTVGATVEFVDIEGSHKDGIYIEGSSDTKVLEGKSSGSPNCRIRGTGSGNSIAADCGGQILG